MTRSISSSSRPVRRRPRRGRPAARACREAGPRRSRTRAARRGPRGAAPRASARARASARRPAPARRRPVVQRRRLTGITPASAQRFSVEGETPEIRAASLSEIVSRPSPRSYGARPRLCDRSPLAPASPRPCLGRKGDGVRGPRRLRGLHGPLRRPCGACGASRSSPLGAPVAGGRASGDGHWWPVAISVTSQATPAGARVNRRTSSASRLQRGREVALDDPR